MPDKDDDDGKRKTDHGVCPLRTERTLSRNGLFSRTVVISIDLF